MPTTKICLLCQLEKPITEFRTNKLHGKEYIRYACRPCDNKRHRKYEKEHQKQKSKTKNARRSNPAYRAYFIVLDCRGADKKKGWQSDLTIEFVSDLISHGCFYCNTKAILMTVDRIDNTLGHLKTNVHPACIRCNDIRKDMPYEAWQCLVPGVRAALQQGLFENWIGALVHVKGGS